MANPFQPFPSAGMKKSAGKKHMGLLIRAVALGIAVAASTSLSQAGEASSAASGDLLFGGCGGVYFLASPGELTVDVVKRDRNQSDSSTELRAILAGPDRQVLQEVTLPDDGRPLGTGLGPLQSCRLSVHVERKGVYALNITLSQDRYGEHAIWGFRSNCPKYLVETARGHRDKRHEEPIVLVSPEREGDICFLPRREAFDIEVTGLPKGTAAPRVLDSRGALVAALLPGEKGQASGSIPAGPQRNHIPWRLHLSQAKAVVQIDGVTRWTSGDLQPDLACWTPELSSWFPWLENRWLLTPYSQTVYGQPGTQKEILLQVRNDLVQKRAIELSVEFPGAHWPVRLSSDRLELRGRKSAAVPATCEVPPAGESRICHVRATPLDGAEFTTYSTLIVKSGEPPASRPLNMPLVLKPYQHENEQFGHVPDFPTDNQVYFDLQNRPFIRTSGGVATLREGKWVTLPAGKSSSAVCSKIAFDRDNHLYVLGKTGGSVALLGSADGGETFDACPIPGGSSGAFELEEFTGQNVAEAPPAVLRYTRTAKDPMLF